ncbi:energy transducer TonB [Oceanicoccus sagamiensis]|uniref:energy transducer TonB n=1 Tax=Oceanicoccus sagamiensis TaxID=716816 RepID=UPI000A2727BB|nr:energy transducer TonB [Oceanicoccus sagamiensis]
MGAAANSLPDFPAFGDVEINHDRLGFAFCLALAIHAAFILGVSFTREKPAVAPPKLEITLAQHRSKTAPEEADYLAQSNQQGSGTLDEKAMLTTQELSDFQDTAIREVAQQQQQSQSERQLAANTQITTTASSNSKANRQQQQEKTEQANQQQADNMTVVQRSMEIASLEAKLDIQRQAYAKRPRVRRLTSVATKQSDDALYLHNWRTKVEAIGNQHYPSKAKQQQLFGKLRMVVSILPNGDIYQVKILQSSGHKILDQAALKIVHLAAPYDPFPQTMQRKVDVLEIIRTWRFHKDRLSSST